MVLPINGSSTPLNTQQVFERPRQEKEQEFAVEQQPNLANNVEDRSTTAAPIEETSASARTEVRTDNQDNNQQQNTVSPDETVGSQLDIRA